MALTVSTTFGFNGVGTGGGAGAAGGFGTLVVAALAAPKAAVPKAIPARIVLNAAILLHLHDVIALIALESVA